jgi:hypothetical protein
LTQTNTCTGDPPGIADTSVRDKILTKGHKMPAHTVDGMHEEECPINVAESRDSENIQQLDIRVVRVDTALKRQ